MILPDMSLDVGCPLAVVMSLFSCTPCNETSRMLMTLGMIDRIHEAHAALITMQWQRIAVASEPIVVEEPFPTVVTLSSLGVHLHATTDAVCSTSDVKRQEVWQHGRIGSEIDELRYH